MNFSNNIILNVDSYKTSMFLQYPPCTTNVYSYVESRGGKFDQTVMFGLQGFIKQYLLTPVSQANINEAEQVLGAHGVPFNKDGWQYIVDQHKGMLPLKIKAVPEGTIVPTHNVLATVEVTDPKCFWLTTYVETSILRAIWYGTTVATQSNSIKQLILEYLEKNGDPQTIGFKLHDFGARGVSSFESAAIGGAAHLINFMGTDTISGVMYAREYYNAGMAGFSIPAMEHSTVTSWGSAGESQAYKNMLTVYGKTGAILAAVSDSYDVYNAAENIWGNELKQQVIDSGATVVIRPDSGDPVEVTSKLIQILDAKFGSTTNVKGYKVLNYVRLIQGDGVDRQSIADILAAFDQLGYSADNIAFGMGGALLQSINRDTQKFAMKCSAALINDQWVDVSKDPITDPGKASKKGRVTLWYLGGEYKSSVNRPTNWVDKGHGEWKEALVEVYRNGVLMLDDNFDTIRNRTLM